MKQNPHLQPAVQIFEAAEKGKIQGIISAISFDTMYYIMEQSLSAQQATKKLKDLSLIIQIGTVDSSVIASALHAGWNDLEDAIQEATASHSSCIAVIPETSKISALASFRLTLRQITFPNIWNHETAHTGGHRTASRAFSCNIKILAERDTCFCGDLTEVIPLAQSTVSQHLKAGLITGEVEGVRTCYCLNPEVSKT